jgi:heme exporter protein C
MYAIAVILIRTRAIILERERHTAWVGQLQEAAQ